MIKIRDQETNKYELTTAKFMHSYLAKNSATLSISCDNLSITAAGKRNYHDNCYKSTLPSQRAEAATRFFHLKTR